MSIDLHTAYFVTGIVFAMLPITAWTILYKRHDSLAVALWCLGGLAYGIGFTMVSMKLLIDPWLGVTIGSSLAIAAYPLRAMALEREVGGRVTHRASGLALWALATAVYVAVDSAFESNQPQLLVALVAHLLGAIWLARLSWKLRGRTESRSASMVTIAFGAFAATLLVRLVAVVLGPGNSEAFDSSFGFVLTFATSIFVALYSNIGYIGIALESARTKELERSVDLAREHEKLIQSEVRAVELGALLEERSELLARREEMLGALAHEVRQPLNNASAALQSAAETVARSTRDPSATERLERATNVLTQVTSSLDNTLADAALLGSDETPSRQDVDIDMLVNLAIADVDMSQRWRVSKARDTETRTATMNVGLMRLALRNLIANALAYTPAGSPVVVRISDSDDPLALLIEVQDQGPGFQAELLPKLFTRGARGDQVHNRLGHGLGLFIVRRVMDMHGGTVRVTKHEPVGMSITLCIPQTFAE